MTESLRVPETRGLLSVAGPATLRVEPRPSVSSCVHDEDPVHPRVSATGFPDSGQGPLQQTV